MVKATFDPEANRYSRNLMSRCAEMLMDGYTILSSTAGFLMRQALAHVCLY